MLLQKLIVDYDCKIQLLYLCRTKNPEINYEFDLWNLSKSNEKNKNIKE